MNHVLPSLMLVCLLYTLGAQAQDDNLGKPITELRADEAERGQLFSEGNYAMFIHFGLYAQLANRVDGKTYYGIGEWIMNSNMAGIPIPEYKALADTFNPVNFNALEIAQLAKDAGMKYIVITSKHHDGFAMFHSKVHPFNIVDATLCKRDLMKEMAEACGTLGIGLGFYYSHWQDWTEPGGGNGPRNRADGAQASFDDYFTNKCLPQVEEITTGYGPIAIVWFDTPGGIPKQYVEQLVAVVRKNQPNALISGRAGHDLGDYLTNGDMHVPNANIKGLWETVDTTNDSWAYAWYDENWKSPKEILRRLINTVGRGGTYMLNIGPRGDGSVPERATKGLRSAGEWIRRYPQVVYGADASPWGHALPWGDVTAKGNTLMLSVFEWPASGKLYLPGLKTPIQSARLLGGGDITANPIDGWNILDLPPRPPEPLISVIKLVLEGAPEVDSTFGIDPDMETEILAEFAEVQDAKKERVRWMEKFGEWKSIERVHAWEEGGKSAWTVNVLEPGEYAVDLTYTGEGRLVWAVDIEGGSHIQNQQNSSHNYQRFPIGWLSFQQPGRYTIRVSCIEGDLAQASLKSIHFRRVAF